MAAPLICLFCPAQLGPRTKPEHILLNVLGGRKSSRKLICSDCNETFGSSVDRNVASQVAALRNHFQLRSGDGKLPPRLRNIDAGGERIDLLGDGTPELLLPPFSIERHQDGTATVQLNLRAEEDLDRYLPHIAAQLGVPVSSLIEQFAAGSAVRSERRPGAIHHNISFGGEEFIRSATKACLELWATLVGNAEVQAPVFAAAREFVARGSEAFNLDRTALDTRPVEADEFLKAEFGQIYNLIYVRSDAAGRVVGHFTLYNLLGWRIVLAEHGVSPDRSVGLISNPLDPRDWSDRIADTIELSRDWLEQPRYDFSEARQRFNTALQLALERGRSRETERIFRTEFAGRREDEMLDLEDAATREMVSRIAERLTLSLFGLPTQRAVGEAELREMVSAAAQRMKTP